MTRKLIILCLLFEPVASYSQVGMWTWMKGDSTPSSLGNYGILGVPDQNNTPRALYEVCDWKDTSGNFWIFGGTCAQGNFSDMWKYNPLANEWVWMMGTGIQYQPGNYGVKGIFSPTNIPGARAWGTPTWVDKDGNFWLFGGEGCDINGTTAYLNDLWKYNAASNEWTWVNGDSIGMQKGIYGTKGLPGASNKPGGRYETSAAWTDDEGNLWLYGGYGIDADSSFGYLSDMWKYNIATNEWTWIQGSKFNGVAPFYGTQGISDPANTPGGRYVYTHWKDNLGNLWLFEGTDGADYNDLWKFDISTTEWAWMNGTSFHSDTGNYGIRCEKGKGVRPPSRNEARACWKDANGNFWLYGGISNVLGGWLNDLWVYEVSSNEWIWISGDDQANGISHYGTQTIASASNNPRPSIGPVGWIDNSGSFWFFGGMFGSPYNDLWKYTPDPDCFPVGISEIERSLSLTVYPNPSSGLFTINMKQMNNQEWRIQVLNLFSNCVFEIGGADNNFKQAIDLSDLPSGMYLIKLTLENSMQKSVKILLIH